MAVRDFIDEKEIKWKVWPVLRASIHPRTAVEDYLGDYGDGWLCFESEKERRRLAAVACFARDPPQTFHAARGRAEPPSKDFPARGGAARCG